MNGIINLYKEKGFTSHDAVAKLRGILHTKKIGHTGTLDPDAEGVLPVCVGSATKVCGILTGQDKVYEAAIRFGVTTDTLDMTGRIVRERPVDVSKAQLLETLHDFTGTIEQIPPMYSAIKVKGKRLYELAREGREIEREPRSVEIYGLALLSENLPDGECAVRVHCSKGTYIRSLCHDIGERLGCGGAMKSLVRTRTGQFSIGDAVTLSQVEEAVLDRGAEQLFAGHSSASCGRASCSAGNRSFLPVDAVFEENRSFRVEERGMRLLANGNPLPPSVCLFSGGGPAEGECFRAYGAEGCFYALYRYSENDGLLHVEKFFGTGVLQ